LLINQTSGELLAREVRRCDTFWRRLSGLMFRRQLDPEEVLLFDFGQEGVVAASVHMLFVFFPIALVWLNAQHKVVDVRLAKPFRLYYAPRRAARYLVEGPSRLMEQVRVGDLIGF
jgi:uncharacterized membrane protein (UPF0127 family)